MSSFSPSLPSNPTIASALRQHRQLTHRTLALALDIRSSRSIPFLHLPTDRKTDVRAAAMSSETPASNDAPPPPYETDPAESSTAAAAAATDKDKDKDEETITFTVKSIADTKIPITVGRFISILELKQKLAEPSSIPVDRQRLIYSGRVLKDDHTVDSYKIQTGHTVHLVKGAASNASAARGNVGGGSASTSGAATAGGAAGGGAGNPTPQLPSMAAGTGMNPLSRLTNHIPLPSADLFGPDGGMGPPPDPEHMLNMLEQPEVRASMNALLQNPALLDSMIQSNPVLQSMGPEARRMMQSEEFRRMMTDPAIIRQMSQMQRMMGMGPFGRGGMFGGPGGAGAFPAPGVTDQTPADQQQQGDANANANAAGAAPQGGVPGMPPANPFAALFNPVANAASPPPQGAGGAAAGSPPAVNPFMFLNPAMFGGQVPPNPAAQAQTQTPGSGDAAGAGAGAGQPPFNPFMPPGVDLNQLQNMIQAMGLAPGGPFGGGAPPAPADTRPPEERYADQLRQLNDMGFTDFDRNVTALRRSGGSVQGAVEYLLSSP
ncbi:Ubiquilin [Drechslerella dactyloides]|uniref:Ubiquilin n=1 Tax=Drechslerella dactyloides TaxID=74499 RepID=A0AAD6NP70_DREDA|nr:Ubiquilin [Drechslerella dactyloides]